MLRKEFVSECKKMLSWLLVQGGKKAKEKDPHMLSVLSHAFHYMDFTH